MTSYRVGAVTQPRWRQEVDELLTEIICGHCGAFDHEEETFHDGKKAPPPEPDPADYINPYGYRVDDVGEPLEG